MKKMPVLVALSGKAGSGKDTIADFMEENLKGYTVKRIAFADLLKRVCSIMFHVPLEWFYDRDKKDTEITHWGLTPRELAIYFGTDLVRNHLYETVLKHSRYKRVRDLAKRFSYWIIAIEPEFEDADVVIVTDMRFLDELKYVLEHKKHLAIRLYREVRDVHAIQHESETALDNVEELFDFVVSNDGTLYDLEEKAKQIANDILEKLNDNEQ